MIAAFVSPEPPLRCRRRRWACVIPVAAAVCLATAVGLAGRASAAEATRAGQTDPLDKQLLDQLLRDPIDRDLPEELIQPKPQPPRPETPQGAKTPPERPATKPDADLQQMLRRQLGAAALPETVNPLLEIARAMREVQGRLARTDSGQTTQQVQQRIVASLEELIRRARSQCQACAASSQQPQQVAERRSVQQPQQSQKPGGRSQARAKPRPVSNPNAAPGHADPQRPNLEQMRGLLEQLWGQLPPTQRQQMLELPIEELFLPAYDLWIEQYFRRLAEQRPPEAPTPAP